MTENSTIGTSSADRMPAPNTAEAASLYQRLRGHLAVLKLHDAAEALP
ncbi:AAA family ATPase, partial [Rhodococcus erythropolis]|nr:AAA family ATPase [Rhodococcus erythropolis]